MSINLFDHLLDHELLDEAESRPQRMPARIKTAAPAVAKFSGTQFWAILICILVLASALALQSRGHGYKTRVMHWMFPHSARWMSHPAVALVRPATGTGNVATDAFVSIDVRLPNGGEVVDGATVTSGAVRLYRSDDGESVDAAVNTTAAGDAVVLRPALPLDLNTSYTFEILPALKDTGGASFVPFRSRFTTAASNRAEAFPAAFQRVGLPQSNNRHYTCVTVGPDHKLYASTADGKVIRFPLGNDGTIDSGEMIVSAQTTGGPRLITGLCFDPTDPAENPVLWISHGQVADGSPADWTGKIGRLTGPTLSQYEDVIVGLPRSTRDHLTNQMAFGPDGALYIAQAGNTAMGAPDSGWGMRPERLLGCAILRVDVRALGQLPIDVKTDDGGKYDPFAKNAPLTLYATGLRNSFDLLWHRNGWLYAPINGSSAGGNVPGHLAKAPRPHRIDDDTAGAVELPAAEALNDLRLTEQDVLARVEAGGYYGHPNPSRGEFVLNGGNPTAKLDPFEIPQYPPGTAFDRNWRRPIFDFGKHLAPCGLIEYRGGAFGGVLDGKILVTRFSGGKDLIVLTPDSSSGSIYEAFTGIEGFSGFDGPVDVCEDVSSGCLYVAEYTGRRITLLRPTAGGTSPRVFRQSLSRGSDGPPNPRRADRQLSGAD